MVHCRSACGCYVSPRRGTPAKPAPETAGTHETRAVIAVAEIAVRDRAARGRRVNEASRARVDPDVIDAAFVDVEENQVARLELAERHGACRALLLARRARNRETEALVHVERKPAAVEAARVSATEMIGSANERDRERGNGRAGVGRRGGAARMAGTAGERQ